MRDDKLPVSFWDVTGEHHCLGRGTQNADAVFGCSNAGVFILRAHDVIGVVEASSSGVEASLESRGVMRDVRPNSESRNGMKEAAGLGEAKMSASMILRLTEMT